MTTKVSPFMKLKSNSLVSDSKRVTKKPTVLDFTDRDKFTNVIRTEQVILASMRTATSGDTSQGYLPLHISIENGVTTATVQEAEFVEGSTRVYYGDVNSIRTTNYQEIASAGQVVLDFPITQELLLDYQIKTDATADVDVSEFITNPADISDAVAKLDGNIS